MAVSGSHKGCNMLREISLLFQNRESEKQGPSDSLKRLREITKELPMLSDFQMNPTNGWKTINVDGGKIKLRGLYKDENAAISYVKHPAGCTMKMHVHEENEWIGQMSGSIFIKFKDGKQKTVKHHEGILIPRFTPHEVHYTEKGEQWAVTMPANPDFPEGPDAA